ncbi:MAG: DUF6541 family protein [Eggerthellaceae bacterium]
MWDMLCAATLALALFLYLPSYLLLRSFNSRRGFAIATAPLVASSVYSLEAIVYAKLGIASTWASIVAPLAIAAAILYAIGIAWKHSHPEREREAFGIKLPGARMGLFLGTGIAACALFYILPMGSADALICGNDIVHHISLNRAFVETGNWSTLETTTTPGSGGAFYPSLWSLFAALPMSALGTSSIVASHAVNILIIVAIFPLSSCLLAESLFKGKPFAICLMGVLSFAFFGFPWEMFLRKTLLYPNALGFALMPGFLACFMLAFEPAGKAERAKSAALAFAGLGAICLAHPNTFFTAAVFVYAFLLHRVLRPLEPGNSPKRSLRARTIAAVALTCVFVAAWVALSQAPFLQSIASNPHNMGTKQFLIGGLARIAVLKSPHLGTQAVLAVFVAAGFLSLLRKGEKHWIVLPFAIMALLYSLSISLDPCTLKSILTGFWYNHPTRVFASVTLFAMPLAAQGAQVFISLACRAASKVAGRRKTHQEPRRRIPGLDITRFQAAALAVAALAAFALPLPLPGAMNCIDLIDEMRSFYDPDGETAFFTQEEREFCQKATEAIPEGARVLNMPNDGSAFAYALFGMNVSGRDFYNSDTCDSAVGSAILEDIEAGKTSAADLREAGFEYVIVLDSAGDGEKTIYQNRFDKDQWKGILALNENTEGLAPILSEDGMALYAVENE